MITRFSYLRVVILLKSLATFLHQVIQGSIRYSVPTLSHRSGEVATLRNVEKRAVPCSLLTYLPVNIKTLIKSPEVC